MSSAINFMGNFMDPEHDPNLQRLFADAHQPLPSQDFLARHIQRLEREKQRALLRQIFGLVVILVGVAFLAPWLAGATEAAFHWAGESAWPGFTDMSFDLGQHGISSLGGWLVLGVSIAAAPLFLVWRLLRS